MSVQPPSPAGNDFKLPVHQIDATKKRVHPRFVTGFYQNIRVVSMYFLLVKKNIKAAVVTILRAIHFQ